MILAVILAVRVAGISASSAILITRPLKLFAQIGPIIGIKPKLSSHLQEQAKQKEPTPRETQLKKPDQSNPPIPHTRQTILYRTP